MNLPPDEPIRFTLRHDEGKVSIAHLKPSPPSEGKAPKVELVFAIDPDGNFSVHARPVLSRS